MPQSTQTNSHGAEEDLKDKAAEVGENVRKMGSQVSDAAREKYEDLRSRASDYFEQGKEKAQEWEEDVESYIKSRPIQALLIAAGVGVVLGMLWRRR
jgi:ElaB/YqjD/DUF883 family membrane-anchored ribosome-binding protein